MPKMRKRSAPRTLLQDGEHSIDRVQPRIVAGRKVIDWRIRIPGHSAPLQRRTQVPAGRPDWELRRRAKETAETLLQTYGVRLEWSPRSNFGAFVEEKVIPSIESSNRLADRSKQRYLLSVRHLLGRCLEDEHKHSLAPLRIERAVMFKQIENCLLEVAALHGAESAKQARSVFTGYVLTGLRREEMEYANPLQGHRMDFKGEARAAGRVMARKGAAGPTTLSARDYRRVVDHLLTLDPTEGVQAPKRGRWTLDDAIAKRRATIELTLLQAGTGLRISEALSARFADMRDEQDSLILTVPDEAAKGGVGREVVFLEEEIATHFRERMGQEPDGVYLAGSPASPDRIWDLGNCTKAVKFFYLEMHRELGVDVLEKERSHVWRATLNTLLADVLPEAHRTAQLGHTIEVSRQHYLNKRLTGRMVERAQEALSNT